MAIKDTISNIEARERERRSGGTEHQSSTLRGRAKNQILTRRMRKTKGEKTANQD
jgi:hypothetical protein